MLEGRHEVTICCLPNNSSIRRVVFLLPTLLLGQSTRMATAQSYLQQGRIEEARKVLLELLQESPNHQVIRAMLGQIAFSRKSFSKQLSIFEKLTP